MVGTAAAVRGRRDHEAARLRRLALGLPAARAFGRRLQLRQREGRREEQDGEEISHLFNLAQTPAAPAS